MTDDPGLLTALLPVLQERPDIAVKNVPVLFLNHQLCVRRTYGYPESG